MGEPWVVWPPWESMKPWLPMLQARAAGDCVPRWRLGSPLALPLIPTSASYPRMAWAGLCSFLCLTADRISWVPFHFRLL